MEKSKRRSILKSPLFILKCFTKPFFHQKFSLNDDKNKAMCAREFSCYKKYFHYSQTTTTTKRFFLKHNAFHEHDKAFPHHFQVFKIISGEKYSTISSSHLRLEVEVPISWGSFLRCVDLTKCVPDAQTPILWLHSRDEEDMLVHKTIAKCR